MSYRRKHLIAGHLGRLGTRDDVTLPGGHEGVASREMDIDVARRVGGAVPRQIYLLAADVQGAVVGPKLSSGRLCCSPFACGDIVHGPLQVVPDGRGRVSPGSVLAAAL